MSTFFLFIYRFFSSNKTKAIILLCAILGISVFYASKLELTEDISKVLPANKKINRMSVMHQSFGDNKLIVFAKEFATEAIPQLYKGLPYPDKSELAAMTNSFCQMTEAL